MNKQCYAAAVGMFSIRFVSIFRLRTVGIIDTWVENKQQRIHITHTCRVTSHVLLRRVRRMQTGTCNCSRTTKVLYPQRAWKLPSGGAGGSESSGSGSRSSQQSNWQTYYIVDMTWQTPQGHNKPAMLAFDSVFRHTGPELACIYVARCTLYAARCKWQNATSVFTVSIYEIEFMTCYSSSSYSLSSLVWTPARAAALTDI